MNDKFQKIVAQQEKFTRMISQSSLSDLAFLNPLGTIYDTIKPTQDLLNSITWFKPNISLYPSEDFYTSLAQFSRNYDYPILDSFRSFQQITQAFDDFGLNRLNNIYSGINLGAITCAQEILNKQLDTISKLKSYEGVNIDEYGLKDVLETANINELEKQIEIIESVNSPIKTYLKENHLTILSIILSIVFFVWTMLLSKQTSEQNEKIISLLEQQNQISIEQLSETQQQTKLIEIQSQLLKELVLDINTIINLEMNKRKQ